MAYTLTTNWIDIQERNIDPYSPVTSDNHNKLLKILGNHKSYIKGFDISFLRDVPNQKMIARLTKGICVLSFMVIEFTETTTIQLFQCPVGPKIIHVVVEYEYEKIKPTPIALIKVIDDYQYDENKHLKLYTYHLPILSTLPTLEDWEDIVDEDNRKDPEVIPPWAINTFVQKAGDVMTGDLYLVTNTPVNPLEAASKGYVDYCIANHDSQHNDEYVKLIGSTMVGNLTMGTISGTTNKATVVLGRNPIANMEATPKQYVDTLVDDVRDLIQDNYVKKIGDTMTGNLVISSAVLTVQGAAGGVNILGTLKGDGYLYSGTVAPTNTTSRLNYNGYFYATRVYNAVYNDYAECFPIINNLQYSRIVQISDKEYVELAQHKNTNVVGIISNSAAFIINGTSEEIDKRTKAPIAMSGTVLVDADMDFIKNAKKGMFIVCSKDGLAKPITKQEYISEYIGCVVGKIIDIVDKQYKVLVMML